MDTVLKTYNLSKKYGKIQALNDISLNIERGNVYGILGPNGSGKTTFLSLVLDIIQPNAGLYDWFGQGTSYKLRKKIGTLLEMPNFYPYLSAERNLKICADIKGVSYSDIERVLQFVNLYERKSSKYKTFSYGMKQRLAIASALLGKPEVLILDEPTNGLDPQGIYEIRELIYKASGEGITIILASHVLDEVEKICTHAAIIKKGVLMAHGRVNELIGKEEEYIELKANDMDALLTAIKEFAPTSDIKKETDKYIVKFNTQTSTEDINKYLFDKGICLTHLVSRKKSLEMQFLKITH